MNQNRYLALAGIMTAVTVILLFAAMIVPNLKLVLYGLSSLPMAALLLETNRRTGIMFYIATAALALILLPDKMAALPYVTVLGLYGLIKAVAEKFPNRIIEWTIKEIYFNATLFLYGLLIYKVFMPNITFPIPIWAVVLCAEALFVAYDYIYSICILYYEKLFRQNIKRFTHFTKKR